MEKFRLLYVATDITPFLPSSPAADYVRRIPQLMQEKGMEIRILVPRFGIINERKNRLHEVVRLSGINISVGDDEKPLIIKVASIPSAKLQVYFIDNDDFFQRKSLFADADGTPHDDNDEKSIFFCKGVLETVKKLGWAPDVVHCVDWMSSLIPLYLKTTYRKDPVFRNTKSIFSVFDTYLAQQHPSNLPDKVKMMDVEDSMLAPLAQSLNYEGFVRMGMEYADVVSAPLTAYHPNIQQVIDDYATKKDIMRHIEYPDYYELYTQLQHEAVSMA